MYTKFLIVSLFQAVLARNIQITGPFFRTSHNSERLYYLRNPESGNFEIHNRGTQLRSDDFNNYKSHLDENHGKEFYERYTNENENRNVQVNRQTGVKNNEYQVRNDDGKDQFKGRPDTREQQHGDTEINHSRRKHDVNKNENRTYSKSSDGQDELKTNLDTQINSSHQTLDGQLRTNKKSGENSYTQSEDKPIEITTVPVGHVIADTLNDYEDFHSRSIYVGLPDDNLAEVKNSDRVTFAPIDKPQPSTSDKATTDNEVRYNGKGTEGKDEDDTRWVWDSASPSTTSSTAAPTETTSLMGDLDDRTSFNGDKCPTGLAKVGDICVKTHDMKPNK